MEWLLAIVGGSCGAAVVTGIFSVVTLLLKRKAQKEDQAENTKVANCAARGEEIRELKEMMEVLFLADRTILYDRIKHLAKSYINRGYITIEEMEDLKTMHSVYHDEDKLDGNGFLDEVMTTVCHSLEKRAN